MLNVNIGKEITMLVNADALPAVSIQHVVMIGLRNILMDSHAGVKRDDFATVAEWQAASLAVAEKKLAALVAGEIRTNGTRTRTVDPLARELNRLARSHGAAAIKAGKLAEADFDAWAEKFKKKPAVVALAQANVDLEIDDEAVEPVY